MNLRMAAENNEKTRQLPRILFPYPDIENIFLHQPSFHPPLPHSLLPFPVYLIQFLSGRPSRCNKGKVFWWWATQAQGLSLPGLQWETFFFIFCALTDFCNLWSCSSEKWAERYFIAWTLFLISRKSSGQDAKSPGSNTPSWPYPFGLWKFSPEVCARNSRLWNGSTRNLPEIHWGVLLYFLFKSLQSYKRLFIPLPNFFTSVGHQWM